ncbi:MAG TPA: serine/threonine-protein phosphatase [Leucothrix mucor]|nr:serine/threonine-protein phosphatase [Leucothrix mucor]
MKFDYHHITDIGDREENQDACAILKHEDYILLALSDGMGSYIDSKKAADCFCQISCESGQPIAINSDDIEKSLREYFIQVVAEIPSCMQQAGAESDMPYATGVLAYIDNKQTIIAHVGDSRAYLITNDSIIHTQDHSMAQLLANQGVISQEDIKTHPSQAQLLRYLAKQPLEVEITHFPKLEESTIILLCSDGLWPLISDDELRILIDDSELDLSLKNIVETVKQRAKGHSDNITIQILRDSPKICVIADH